MTKFELDKDKPTSNTKPADISERPYDLEGLALKYRKGTKSAFNITLPDSLIPAVKQLAEVRGQSASELFTELAIEAIRQNAAVELPPPSKRP